VTEIRRYERFLKERVREQEERELLAVLEDRERIARDLHDVVIIPRLAAAS
jgi:signal transduction histidine kinase